MTDGKHTVEDKHGNEYELTTEDPMWITIEGQVLEFIDYPTDGPLFRDPDEEEWMFAEVQFTTDGFESAVKNGEVYKLK